MIPSPIQEESGEIDIKEDNGEVSEFLSSDFTDERHNYDQTDSISFINFQDDASDIRQIILSDADRELEVKSPKRRKSLSVAEIDRPDSAGYSRTITCICIKVNNKNFIKIKIDGFKVKFYLLAYNTFYHHIGDLIK